METPSIPQGSPGGTPKDAKGKETPGGDKKSTETPTPVSNDIIAGNYVLLNQIGKGAFGEIFLSFNLRDNIEVAIKKEVRRPNKPSQLRTEAKVYQSLLTIDPNQDLTGTMALAQKTEQGVPKFYGMGELPDGTGFYLIIEFLGPNLNELFKFCNMKKFTISTVCLLAIQILNRIENVHKHNFLHRDIKPENFMIGSQETSNVIYLIDFGLSKRYKNIRNNQHIPYREGRNLIGTARYVSINTHLGIEQSRRDDLESIGYVVIFFLKGYLPWQGLKGGDKYQRIMEKKLQIPTDILCLGLPEEISIYLNYVKGLRFEDRPDYDFLRGLFIKTLSMCVNVYGIEKDYLKFDWSFEDPKNTIWELYKDKGKKMANMNASNNFDSKMFNNEINNMQSKENAGDGSSVKAGENPTPGGPEASNVHSANVKSKITKQLTKINETTDNNGSFDKTNENNPNISSDASDDSSDNSAAPKKKDNTIEEEKENEQSKAKPKEEKKNDDSKSSKSSGSSKSSNSSKSKKSNPKEEKKQSFKKDTKASKKSSQKPEEKKSAKNDTESKESEETLNEEFCPKKLEISGIPEVEELHKTSQENQIDTYIDKLYKGVKFQTKNLETNANDQNLHKIEVHHMDPTISQNDAFQSQAQEKSGFIDASKGAHIIAIETPCYKAGGIANEINSEAKKKMQKIIDEDGKENSNAIDISKEGGGNENVANETPNPDKKPNLAIDGPSSGKDSGAGDKLKGSVIDTIDDPEFRQKSKQILTEDFPKNQVTMKLTKEALIKIKKEPVTKFYTIIGDIGQGSYGKVKRVKHKKLYEERAMKIVSKQSESSHNEIEILRRVSHPNIVNIFEIFEDSKKYYIITELLDGGELFEFIMNQGTFIETDAAILMKQILNGVNYLHSQYIVHRDLKPENIMLISKPNAAKKYSLKIIDFGTAIQIRPGQKINKFIGTSYYIAPEVLAENYNEKCDVWSCGVIMHILLGGYPPFNGSTNVDIFRNIQYSQPMFNSEEWKDVSPAAIDLIRNMLNKIPSRRYTAEMCLNHAWFKENENLDPFGLKGYNKKYNQLKAVNKMAEFVKENKFKQAVLQFITTQFDIKQEEENLKDIFKQFDVENTGQITKKVFLKELVKLYGEEDAKALTNKIFNTLDLDGNGDISYNEFLTSIIDSKKFITNDRLDKAFKMFDKDGNGKLSIDEIKAVFGGDEKKWRKIISDVDLNDDGEVDFEEFKMLMTGMNPKELTAGLVGKDKPGMEEVKEEDETPKPENE